MNVQLPPQQQLTNYRCLEKLNSYDEISDVTKLTELDNFEALRLLFSRIFLFASNISSDHKSVLLMLHYRAPMPDTLLETLKCLKFNAEL